jgi:hypothetical protein
MDRNKIKIHDQHIITSFTKNVRAGKGMILTEMRCWVLTDKHENENCRTVMLIPKRARQNGRRNTRRATVCRSKEIPLLWRGRNQK